MTRCIRVRPRPRRTGFTLFEVIVAIGLLVALVGSMFAFMNNLLVSREKAREFADKELAASTLIDRLEAALATCLVGDSVSGAGVRGDASGIRILSRGVAVNLAERGAGDPDVFGDLQETEFRFDARGRIIEGRKQPVSATQRSSGAFWPVGRAGQVRFRYHDGTGWQDSFDSLASGRLPLAVEVAIWFAPWPDAEDVASSDDDFYDIDNYKPERLTFDADAGFDESEFADRSELDRLPPPIPDRVRVIAIRDAEPDDLTDASPSDEGGVGGGP